MAYYFFISTRYRHRTTLLLCAIALAFVVILLGAYTRLTDAGLSCPDWPHCYGYLTAPHTTSQLQTAAAHYPLAPVNIKKAWTEMTHRYFAGVEGVLILSLAFLLLFKTTMKDTKINQFTFILISLLGIQVLLGMLTVTEKLKPIIVLSHLLTGLSILCVLWWGYLVLPLRNLAVFKHEKTIATRPLLLGCIILIMQIILGGWVSTHYAGLACVDFPYCNGQLLPNLQLMQFNQDLITIHMLHRIGAFITALYISLLALYLLTHPAFRGFALLLSLFLFLQLCLGILNILWLRPVSIALLHHAIAILLLLTLITTWVKASVVKGKHHEHLP